MVRIPAGGLAAFSALLLGGWIGTAAAQNTAPLSSMPMPPSASDPAPKATKSKARKPARKRSENQGAPAASGSSASFDRPNRYVPEEFDREGRSGPTGGAAPMMSPSGRPGMGMRF
ncbi:hypothetical protein [Enterovirga rhinocerotis]|uniref:Translation initiation factor IF-2 n=1 Tax=Enterovirga rhinocerotis TaxID=1339210 RepID=A0A4V3DYQ7_9HYPH|nr:hypothetical protein [Enterovirga rhinocerotis]TDR93569.1 hypothetical protein EV668_0834 [Enterovirga rhinocerotis]